MIRTMLSQNCPDSKNWTIFHTCSITAEAERQVRQQIRKFHKTHPDRKVIITGCSSETSTQTYIKMPEVWKVISNKNKLKLDCYLSDNKDETIELSSKDKLPEPKKEVLPKIFYKHSKAFIQIQQGCNHFCTYCIVPFTRGRSYSFSQDLIFTQIQNALDAGYNEVNLTGVDVVDYKDKDGVDLTQLIKNILRKFKNLPRLRLTSMDPYYDCTELFQVMAHDKRLMPFLHLSMQNGDDTVLKKMNRRHRQSHLRKIINEGREIVPNLGFGADIITGFPEETDEEFENTYNLVKELQIPHLHIFPYSERPGTAAEKLKPVPVPIRKERAKRLRELKDGIVENTMKSMIGQTVSILSEGKNGYTENYFKVEFDTEQENGKIITGKLKSFSLGSDPAFKIEIN